MKTEDKYKLVNQGYSLELFLPEEFKEAIKKKMLELSKTGKNKERWEAISKGYEMALLERTQKRQQELAKAKKGRGKSKERNR